MPRFFWATSNGPQFWRLAAARGNLRVQPARQRLASALRPHGALGPGPAGHPGDAAAALRECLKDPGAINHEQLGQGSVDD